VVIKTLGATTPHGIRGTRPIQLYTVRGNQGRLVPSNFYEGTSFHSLFSWNYHSETNQLTNKSVEFMIFKSYHVLQYDLYNNL